MQYFFLRRYSGNDWLKQVTQGGFDLTYASSFGNPFGARLRSASPLDLSQPTLRLPMEKNSEWYFHRRTARRVGHGQLCGRLLILGPPIDGCGGE